MNNAAPATIPTPASVELPDTAGMTAEEMTLSLNKFDVIACRRHMDTDPLGGDNASDAAWALAFVFLRRCGLADPDAKAQAMAMTVGQINDLFDDEPEEIDEDDPETDAGKDSSPSETTPPS